MVVPDVIEQNDYPFGFYCNSSLSDKNSFYNVVCKYHPSPYDAKILPKRPQIATNKCFTKLNDTSAYSGVSETPPNHSTLEV